MTCIQDEQLRFPAAHSQMQEHSKGAPCRPE